MKRLMASTAIALTLMTSAAQAQLQSELFVNGVSSAVYVTHANDGSGRVFIVQQNGIIRIADSDGNLQSSAFLNIDPLVQSGGERGLLGLAFHPDYAVDGADGEGKFYLNYTQNGGATVIAEYSVFDFDPNTADPNSARVLMTIAQPFSNHNGGWIGFGPDGYLYISTGDGGSGGDPGNRSASLDTLLGKMLRIDVDTQDAPLEYGIPDDNAWANDGDANTRGEIYHYGLRNAWRCSFDRDTGDFWMADVGQNAWEEINHNVGNTGGLFYGWRCREGLVQYSTGSCGVTGWTDPQYVYGHGEGCSVTGGYVYRGCALGEEYQGLYFFADYCTGIVWTLDPSDLDGNNLYTRSTQFSAGFGITSFGEDEAGEIYYTRGSAVYKIVNPNAVDDNDNGIADSCEGCQADFTGDGMLDFFDLSAFLQALTNNEPVADITMDGEWDFFDVSAYLGLFQKGCP
jgi:glucose/arabinose dehydrogenase